MKTYVLIVSEKFPITHSRAGEETGFRLAINHMIKIHTIRANYDLWAKRIKDINDGKALLSVRVWSGKPYRSKQQEFFRYDASWSIGVQLLHHYTDGFWIDGETKIHTAVLAENDGLSRTDFLEWFKDEANEAMAIIHFTSFRY